MASKISYQTRSPQSWKKKKVKTWKPDSGQKRVKRANFKFDRKKATKNLIKLGLLLILVIFIYVLAISRNLPTPDKLMEREVAESTKIYDRTGETILYQVFGAEKRTLVELEDIPDNLKNATIAIEDKNFYEHGGFSIWAMFRTFITNIVFGRKAGGSTLTQQFIKNAVLTSEKKYSRKIKEVILAYRLEKKFSKDEILKMYFNEIPYGSNAYGVEAASQYYFGKHVKDITLAEATILAALPQGPTLYSPYGSNKDLLIERQQYILDLMVEQDYISKEEAIIAKNTELDFKERDHNMIAPHFVMYVREMLVEKYGQKTIEQEGLRIITTIDLDKQEFAEEAIKERAEGNEKNYNATNAALVSIDPKTGQILAMVGSKDYFNEDIDGQYNVALAPRQPGSSFKPIVYTMAWIKGYRPATMVYDVVTNFSDNPNTPYEPHNYDLVEHGPVSLRQALAGSLNIPAVKVLYLAGVANVIDLAHKLGYTTLNAGANHYGLSLVLGGGEVKLLEHANAFSAFAQDGAMHEPVYILKIEDRKGEVLEEWKETPAKQVLEPNIARITNNVLSDNGARAYVFGEKNYLTLPGRAVAAKTGTTNDYRDAWTIGYTPSLVTGVWVGNNDNTPMKRGADGSVVAAPIWNKYMRSALANAPVEGFNPPDMPASHKPIIDGIGFAEKKIKIDKYSGLLASSNTPESAIVEKTYLQLHSILHYIKTSDPLGLAPSNPASDPQYNLWESRIQQWAERKKKEDPNFMAGEPPSEEDNLHQSENKPTFSVSGIENGMEITEPRISTSISGTAPRGIYKTEYYINGSLFDATTSFPFSLNRSLGMLDNGSYNLGVRVCDDVDNCSEKDFQIKIRILDNFKKVSNVNISWAGPANNASETTPINLRVNVINPEVTAKIDFYYLNSNGEPQLIQSRQAIDNTVIGIIWDPLIGEEEQNYKVYAIATSWQGRTSKSEEITLKIKGN
ncbi:MAG: PBP1A family penicillin-binding protein [bacterium]